MIGKKKQKKIQKIPLNLTFKLVKLISYVNQKKIVKI